MSNFTNPWSLHAVGGKVTPVLEVLNSALDVCEPAVVQPRLFPSCLITRSQAAKQILEPDKPAEVDLADSVIGNVLTEDSRFEKLESSCPLKSAHVNSVSSPAASWLPVSRERLAAAQKSDKSLEGCFAAVVSDENKSAPNLLWRRLLCLPATVIICFFWLTKAAGPAIWVSTKPTSSY